jgi:putative acetyltransferase
MEFYVRSIESGDACGVGEIRKMPGTFENVNGWPSLRDKFTEDNINNLGADDHVFVAVKKDEPDSGTVIGTASLNVHGTLRTRQVGNIGIMVHADYQSQGVGTALMTALIDIADNWLMLERVELTVLLENDRAIGLYTKFGFEREGMKRHSVIRFGKYADEYYMSRIRSEIISKTEKGEIPI